MGAPTYALLEETFIQHMEQKHIYPILETQQIFTYYIYVSGILIIYDPNKANIEQPFNESNNIQPISRKNLK
jgi:hypothetical protein